MTLLIALITAAFFTETVEDSERATYLTQHVSQEQGTIPKNLHVIWLGSAPFPKESQKNIKGWIDRHPEWSVTFWSDQKRPEIDHRLISRDVTKEDFSALWPEYISSSNQGERAALLRLEILDRWGGAVIDHDVVCKGSLDSYHHKHDLYLPAYSSQSPILSSSVQIIPYLIAAKPHHPLIKETIVKTKEMWDRVHSYFPANDYESTLYRVLYRTQIPLEEALFFHLGDNDTVMVDLPEAKHLTQMTWIKKPEAFLEKINLHLERVRKGQNAIFYSLLMVLGLNSLLVRRFWKRSH